MSNFTSLVRLQDFIYLSIPKSSFLQSLLTSTTEVLLESLYANMPPTDIQEWKNSSVDRGTNHCTELKTYENQIPAKFKC